MSIKGAEDAINKPHAFEVSTTDCSMFFIADSDKVGGRAVGLACQPLHVSVVALAGKCGLARTGG